MSTATVSVDKKQEFESLVTAFRKRAFVGRDLTALDEYLTPDFVDHFAPPWILLGSRGFAAASGRRLRPFRRPT